MHRPDQARKVATALVAWYRRHQRDLPWRRTSDPYAIWISEIMLQQTRVDTVIPYYERFLQRWPTVRDLAQSDPEDVRAAWSGLGYYRRAQLMLKAAASIVSEHEGSLPGAAEELRTLPGFGRYTAGAVASIAFGQQVGAVDGNAIRVLARIFGIRGEVNQGPAHEEVWAIANDLATREPPSEMTQAIMEIGAMICHKSTPRCEACPAAKWCVAKREDAIAEIPPVRKRRARTRIDLTSVLAKMDDRTIVLQQQAEKGLFAGLWCLPFVEGRPDSKALRANARSRWGLELGSFDAEHEIKHVLTHRDIFMKVVVTTAKGEPIAPAARVALDGLDKLGVPAFTARALKKALPKTPLPMTQRTTKLKADR